MGGIKELIELPQQIQIALAAGFIGYLIAFAGVRSRHTQIEMALYTVVFSVIATAVLNAAAIVWGLVLSTGVTVVSALSAFVFTAMAGYAWQQFRPLVFKVLRRLKLAQHDGTGSATVLDGIINDSRLHWNQLKVNLTDGSGLICENTSDHGNAAIGFVRIDGDGNIAMIATHRDDGLGNCVELDGVRHELGDQVTYIPATQVRHVVIRLKRRSLL